MRRRDTEIHGIQRDPVSLAEYRSKCGADFRFGLGNGWHVDNFAAALSFRGFAPFALANGDMKSNISLVIIIQACGMETSKKL